MRHCPRYAAIVVVAATAILVSGCSPYRISRIGPTHAAKGENCQVELLEQGRLPVRPYRDVGVIELQYCPDYTTGSCRSWTRQAACELGGDVVYLERSEREPFERDPVVYRLNVAAYMDVAPKTTANGCDTDTRANDDDRCKN